MQYLIYISVIEKKNLLKHSKSMHINPIDSLLKPQFCLADTVYCAAILVMGDSDTDT